MITKERFLKLIKQPSTWRGFVYTLGGIGSLLHKEFIIYITPMTFIAAGLIAAFFDDEVGKAAQEGMQDAIDDIKKSI